MNISRRITRRLSPETTSLFVCDIQELFRPLIHNSETVIARSNFVYKLAKLLSIPCFTTEHYSKVFGSTVPDLAIDTPIFQKRMFSMLTEELKGHFLQSGRQSAILVGIETHVCILQTAMDLIANDNDVYIVCDAVSSQRPHDRAVALDQLKSMGAFLTTAESVMFELLRTSTHPQFKSCSAMLKEVNALPNEFEQDRGL